MTKKVKLKDIERRQVKLIKDIAKGKPVIGKREAFLLGVLIGPFSLFGSLFVPLIGLLLSISSYTITFILFWRQRATLQLILFLLGAVLSFITIGLTGRFLILNFSLAFYFLIATSVAVLIFYNLLVAALIYRHLELAQQS
jgi:hypothetical protein